MNLQNEIEKVVMRYIAHVEGAVRERARGIVVASPRAAGKRASKAAGTRGPRHCRVCSKRGHDARNCEKAA